MPWVQPRRRNHLSALTVQAWVQFILDPLSGGKNPSNKVWHMAHGQSSKKSEAKRVGEFSYRLGSACGNSVWMWSAVKMAKEITLLIAASNGHLTDCGGNAPKFLSSVEFSKIPEEMIVLIALDFFVSAARKSEGPGSILQLCSNPVQHWGSQKEWNPMLELS
ncbi:hypothetical protein B0H13DRAFT_1858783 [Mycena leptocephala]|nr:hypothetical protein B0H13DRAFT_1858783 [Mycena leptocephala]